MTYNIKQTHTLEPIKKHELPKMEGFKNIFGHHKETYSTHLTGKPITPNVQFSRDLFSNNFIMLYL